MVEKTSKNIIVNLLNDHSTSTDKLSGKSHTRTATALSKIISSQPNVSSIGLEGDWGSGKSSVIDIAQIQLEKLSKNNKKNGNYPFFIFDTWAYQGDPLRRVFLEELIVFLCAKKILKPKKWIDDRLEKLKSRTK